jgi:hypothetical protein
MRPAIIEWRRRCQRAQRRPSAGSGFILTIFLVAGGLPEAPAGATACGNVAPVTVTVEAHGSEVREAFDTTGTEIRQAAAARGVQAHWPALGAYVAEIAYAADIAEDAHPDENGFYCATPSAVHVVISLQRRVIHLARELREDRCLEEAVRQHERRHARADDRAFTQIPVLSGQLRAALGHLQPARAASVRAAKTLVTDAVRAQVEELLNRLNKDRATLNQSIDAPEAIAELRAQCENQRAGSFPSITSFGS